MLRDQVVREAEGYLELGMPEHALAALYRPRQAGRDEQRSGGGPHLSRSRQRGRACDGYVLFLEGEALRRLERYEEALAPLEEAAERMPQTTQVWLPLAWCYKRTGQLQRAIESLQIAIEIDPSEAILHYNLACYWALMRDKAPALACLAQAFEIDGDFRDLVADEPDFDALRHDADFVALTDATV